MNTEQQYRVIYRLNELIEILKEENIALKQQLEKFNKNTDLSLSEFKVISIHSKLNSSCK
ncbi:hypothetical protein [Daejeonella sp. H1SJ63]|uniref:hypothetical protein n=1 Tax=Daejeonella sp. H1SJ63 TaxID=3034145 RepID=UPI0023EA7A26|nr:hypothetical protein [Daejeonella sp. H1SJ63]